jgi:hypothetical protein
MKTLLAYQGIGIFVEVPNKAKMDYDDKYPFLFFNFAPVRNPRLSHPLLLILFGTVQALPSTLSKMMMVRPSWAGAAVIALFPAIVVVQILRAP